MKKVKYAEVAPWDGGPNQTQTNDPEWVMQKGILEVSFSRNKLDSNYFHIRRGEIEGRKNSSFAFRAPKLIPIKHAINAIGDITCN